MRHLQMLIQMFESELRWFSSHEAADPDRQMQIGYMRGIAHARALAEALMTSVPEHE